MFIDIIDEFGKVSDEYGIARRRYSMSLWHFFVDMEDIREVDNNIFTQY